MLWLRSLQIGMFYYAAHPLMILRWRKYLASMKQKVLTDGEYRAQSDEQHSRPQRFTYGCAPYASAVVMNQSPPYQIYAFTHVDNEATSTTNEVTKAGVLFCCGISFVLTYLGTQVKSKAKLTHVTAFKQLVSDYGDAKLVSLTVDQSTDATFDVEAILRPKWPKLIVNYSLWHKVSLLVILHYVLTRRPILFRRFGRNL